MERINRHISLSLLFFFSFYIKRNLSQNSCGFYASSLLFSPQLSAVGCVAVAPLWYRFACPHCAVGLLVQAEHASPLVQSLQCVATQCLGTRWQFPCTCHLLASPGASEGVLSQCDGGGAVKAECHPCGTRFPWQWPHDGTPWHFFVKMEKVSSGDSRVTWLPGSPSWSDEHRTGSTASAS